MPIALGHLLGNARFSESLKKQHLPAYLDRQRWYTSKGKTIAKLDITGLPSRDSGMGLCLLHLEFADAQQELRVLALTEVDRKFAPDDARVICYTDGGVLIDAVGEESFRESLYQLMAGKQRIQGETGVLVGGSGSVCEATPDYPGSAVPVQNSSNTVMTFGKDGFFKLFRKTEAGLHPDAELLGYLSRDCGFASVPAFGGDISFEPASGGEPITLGLMLGRVDHNGEAWEVMLRNVARYAVTFRDNPALGELTVQASLAEPLQVADIPEVLAKAVGADTLRRITLLGKRTAEMHQHFAKATKQGMQPQPLDDDYWAFAKTTLIDRLRTEAEYADEQLSTALQSIATWLDASTLPRLEQGKIRVHGDYHLGQVLDTKDDVVIIDFEGEPLHSLAYRRRRHPAHKDVAGMVRSLHYAPYAYALQEADGAEWAMRAAQTWYRVAARLYLTSYNESMTSCSFLPNDERGRTALLAFFLADKALYELAYERASRPDWLSIPRTGVLGIADLLSTL